MGTAVAKNQRQKCNRVDRVTYDKLSTAIAKKVVTHDRDVKRFGLAAAKSVGLKDFKASDTWLLDFKRKHRVVSRKVTKFVTRANVANEDTLKEKALGFVFAVRTLVGEYGEANIFNTDQSGFQLELHSGRTLAMQGVKKVEALVQSSNATTHSYTIQPALLASGKVLSPLLVVLQEKNGVFGPKVKDTMFQAPNLYVVASKSGKCTTAIMQDWFQKAFLPEISEDSILLVDSWGGFKKMVEGAESEHDVELHTIPGSTTGMIKPWDVYGARVWKRYVRMISDLVIIIEAEVRLSQRDSIIKLQSLTHNQLTSPRFDGLFKYAWFKAGYIDQRPPEFPDPLKFAFDVPCEVCSVCKEKLCIIMCSWCKSLLCFDDFFIKLHFCTVINIICHSLPLKRISYYSIPGMV